MIPATVYWMEWFLLLSTVSLSCGVIFQTWRCGVDEFTKVLTASLFIAAFFWACIVLGMGEANRVETVSTASASPVCRTVVVRPMGKPLQVAQ